MDLELSVDIKSGSRYPIDRTKIREGIASVLKRHRLKGLVNVSVSIVGDRKMKEINKQYRNKDYSTDVLSFPTYDPTQPMDDGGFAHSEEAGLVLGDIIVSYPQAVKIASQKGKFVHETISDLIEHGLLHLMGIHHD